MHTPVNTSFIMRLVIASFRLISLATMRRHQRRQVPAALESWHVDVSLFPSLFIYSFSSPPSVSSSLSSPWDTFSSTTLSDALWRHAIRHERLLILPAPLAVLLLHFPTSFSAAAELQPGTHIACRHLRILCFPRCGSIAPFYSFTLRIPCRFLLSGFFFRRDARFRLPRRTTARCEEKRKSRSLLELRSEAMEMKRARFIYFPEFCRNALQSRMKRYVEIGALCCASCCSLKKKFREKGRRTHDRRVCALYEYVISWICDAILIGIN